LEDRIVAMKDSIFKTPMKKSMSLLQFRRTGKINSQKEAKLTPFQKYEMENS
jgi:hypothetical protein